MRRIVLFLILSFLAGCTADKPKRGTITHGGDDLRPLFKNAKDTVAAKMRRLRPEKLAQFGTEAARNFFFSHQGELIKDVLNSPHEWTEQPQATCGQTGLERNALITFSFDACRIDAHEPGRRLVHESVHHFSISSESFADDVADLVTSFPDIDLDGSWRNVPPLLPSEPFLSIPEEEQTHAVGVATANGYLVLRWPVKNSIVRAGLFDLNAFKWKTVAAPPKDWMIPSMGFGQVAMDDKVYYWGGNFGEPASDARASNEVFIYTPSSNSWESKSSPSAPTGWDHVELYPYGKKIFVWARPDRAAIYDPQTNQWRMVEKAHGEFWTGREFLGVYEKDDGFVAQFLDPERGTWREIRSEQKGLSIYIPSWVDTVWTGTTVLYFDPLPNFTTNHPDNYAGWKWDLSTNRWSVISAEGAPSPRQYYSKVWTGTGFAVYGGRASAGEGWLQDGAIYNPVENRWLPLTSSTGSSSRAFATSIWTGKQWFLWGGKNPLEQWRLDGQLFTP